jgi:antitoxin component of MazEF toxin-antitoxin module
MGYPTKVQLIQRQASSQWYVNFPAAVAGVLDLQKGEVVEWTVQDRNTLILKRTQANQVAEQPRKKKR